MHRSIDNPRLLCQDCSRPLFRWFLSRIDWRRILKQDADVARRQWPMPRSLHYSLPVGGIIA